MNVILLLLLTQQQAPAVKVDSETVSGLGARNIGSAAMSGRIAAVDAVHEGARLTIYVGSASGGVWKSVNGGTTFKPVFDKQPVQSIGAVTIDPKNPKVIWVGSGESWMRNSVSIGDGIYRSADGGENWTNLGLKNSEHIVKILVDPTETNTVYVCVPGKLWSDSDERGVYKTTDGGKTWTKVLKSANLSTGCSMMSMDPAHPKTLYAGMWDFRRRGWTFRSGGDSATAPSASGLFKSTDGGATWSELPAGATGLPAKTWGRVAVTVAPSKPEVVYAFVEAVPPLNALYRSNDAGKTWQMLDRSQNMIWRPFYFANLIVDPRDPERVYKVDGGLQDNSSWVGPSEFPGGITNHQWENMYGGDGFWMFADPTDPDYLYAEAQGGAIGRVNRRTHESRNIQPLPRYQEKKLRFNWNTPIHISQTQPGTIYIGAQVLFRSKDFGQTWERISPDLTTNDPQKQKQEQSGGITVDNSAAEMHTTIYAIAESPRDGQVVWAGTDDGNLQVTRDGGKTWTSVVGKITGLPKNAWVSSVEAGHVAPGTIYATFDVHTFGDMRPYAYKSTDFGATWTPLVAPDSPVRGYAHVIKEDPVNGNLLYLGTELGLWISVDGGKQWAHYKGGDLPAVAVRDLAVHPRDNDLVIATHGRGIWIVDDITPLRALTPDVLASPIAFLPGRPTTQRLQAGGGWANGDAMYVGANPPSDAVITYYQRRRHIFGDMKLNVYDASGKLVGTMPTSKRRGLNRATWSMRLEPPRVPPAASAAFGAAYGPRVLPGTYTIKLTKDTATYTTQLVLVPDPHTGGASGGARPGAEDQRRAGRHDVRGGADEQCAPSARRSSDEATRH